MKQDGTEQSTSLNTRHLQSPPLTKQMSTSTNTHIAEHSYIVQTKLGYIFVHFNIFLIERKKLVTALKYELPNVKSYYNNYCGL